MARCGPVHVGFPCRNNPWEGSTTPCDHCPVGERRRLPSLPRLISKWHPILARRYNCSHLPLTSIHFSIDRLPTPGPLLPSKAVRTDAAHEFLLEINSWSIEVGAATSLLRLSSSDPAPEVCLSHTLPYYIFDGWVWVASEAKQLNSTQLNSFPPAVSSLLVAVSNFELCRSGRSLRGRLSWFYRVSCRSGTGLAFVVQV